MWFDISIGQSVGTATHFGDKALVHKYCSKFYLLYFVMALFVTHEHWSENEVISNLIKFYCTFI